MCSRYKLSLCTVIIGLPCSYKRISCHHPFLLGHHRLLHVWRGLVHDDEIANRKAFIIRHSCLQIVFASLFAGGGPTCCGAAGPVCAEVPGCHVRPISLTNMADCVSKTNSTCYLQHSSLNTCETVLLSGIVSAALQVRVLLGSDISADERGHLQPIRPHGPQPHCRGQSAASACGVLV